MRLTKPSPRALRCLIPKSPSWRKAPYVLPPCLSAYVRALFAVHGRRRHSCRRRRWRDREGEPRVDARRPVAGVELAVGFQVQISFHVSDRKKVSDLRTDADDARLEGTNLVARTAVTRNLIVNIADQSYEHLLGQELRRAPVEVKVDAVLIIGTR